MTGFDVLDCAVCHSPVERVNGRSQTAALACSSAALLLLIPGNFLPLLTTSLAGVSRQSILASSARVMFARGYPELGVVIGLMVVVLPLLRFGLLTTVLAALRFGRRPHWLGAAFRGANALQTWALADVFLLGFFVAYQRLHQTISVVIGTGAMCFIAAAILGLLTRATLDRGAVWRAIAPDRVVREGEPVLLCEYCEQVLPRSMQGGRCPRCAARLKVPASSMVGITAALALAAALLYLPANLYPIATLPLGLSSVKYTVLEGVIDLTQAKLYGLALLVLTASFAIPLLKLAAIAWCVASVVRRSSRHLVAKTRLFLVVDEIGRWSMVDPFVISCFVPVTQYNALVHGNVEPAAPAFTAVVILTMLATRFFDPRLLWDTRHSESHHD
jgi:paraquat-inducible protein A